MIEDVLGSLIAAGFGLIFIGGFALAAIDLVGKIYATVKIFSRADLTAEQRLIYLLLSWFIPYGWLIYLLLGTERTEKAFSDLEIF